MTILQYYTLQHIKIAEHDCEILFTDGQFKSGLTNITYHYRSWDDLICKSSNIVYDVECPLCVLMYVDETKGQLNKRISGHRFEVIQCANKVFYKQFNPLDHFHFVFQGTDP